MGKVLYSAITANGKVKRGYIDALSNEEAVKKLKEEGFSNINLYSDARFPYQEELDSLSEDELEEIAYTEIDTLKSNTFGKFLLRVVKKNIIIILIGLAIAFYGYSIHSYLLAAFGFIVASFYPFINIWNRQASNAYNNAMRALLFGNLKQAQKETQKLRALVKDKNVLVECDMLDAKNLAKSGNIDNALDILLRHKEYFNSLGKGIFESKLTSLYLSAKDNKKALEYSKKAYELSKDNMLLTDWALAEARFGDIDIAKENIEKVNIEAIPVFGLGFIYFTKGLIEYKKANYKEAKELLIEALYAIEPFKENVATWGIISLIRVYLALTFNKLGFKKEAKKLLHKDVVKIIKVSAPKDLLDELNRLIEELKV